MTASKPQHPARAALMARERLEQYGPSILADEELIAIITGANGQQTAASVLDECGAVQQLPRETVHDLSRLDSVTPRRAATIVAAVELGRRTLTHPAPETPHLGSPRDVASYLLPAHGSHPIERFGIVSLTTKSRVIRTAILSTGTLDAALVHPALVFRTAALPPRRVNRPLPQPPVRRPDTEQRRRRADRPPRRSQPDHGDRDRRPRDPGRLAVLQLQGDGPHLNRDHRRD